MAKCRNDHGISQPALAAKCQILGWDISRDIISGIESGIRGVADWQILVLAQALKVSPSDLLSEKVDWQSIPFPPEEYLQKRRRVLAKVKSAARREGKAREQ